MTILDLRRLRSSCRRRCGRGRHESRVTEALRRIEAEPEEPVSLRQLARDDRDEPVPFSPNVQCDLRRNTLSIRSHSAAKACSSAAAADN
jgi:hypothetical protein